MKKLAVIILAEGFEEIETVTPIDLLRRGGIEVTVAGLSGLEVRGSRGITLKADCLIDEIPNEPDVLILPGGGKGAANLAGSEKVLKLLKTQNENDRIIAAICASPAIVLAPSGIASNKTITCFPAFKNDLPNDVIYKNDRVVTSDNLITSQGPGTAFDFSLTLIRLLAGEEIAEKVKKATLYE
ncbi:MAG: DJ-1/PfpI family protein [Spirochaetes bacterium]|nr:DJ-1/PfpI family protein [Spirochaetota bacterium]